MALMEASTETANGSTTDVQGSCRRFGEYGPAYIVNAVRGAEADIEVLESGEQLTIPVTEVLACPEAE